MAARKKRSKAWLHFTKKDDSSSTCNFCKMIISSKGGTTSNMLKHLSTQHGLKFKECCVFDTLHPSATASQPSSTSVTEEKEGIPKVVRVCKGDVAVMLCEGGKEEPVEIPVQELHFQPQQQQENTETDESEHIKKKPRNLSLNYDFLKSQDRVIQSIDTVATELREVRTSLNELNKTLQTLVSCVSQLAHK